MQRLLVCSLIFYASAVLFLYSRRRGDPTSWFFNPDTAYKPNYSSFRRQQALDYLRTGTLHHGRFDNATSDLTICVGVPSFFRKGSSYLPSAVGSLLAGLGPEERQRLYLAPLIAHADPHVHPVYAESWLADVSDQVLIYTKEVPEYETIQHWEQNLMFRQKALFDYVYLLKQCSMIGTDYIAVLEDDIIAMDGWFHRTMDALHTIRSQHDESSTLYLRLFFTEEFLGWNSENWLTYLSMSLVAAALVAGLLYISRGLTKAHRHLTNNFILVMTFVYLPLLILLLFASGTGVIRTMHSSTSGVNLMNKFGCCGQGLVFSHARAQEMIPFYESKGFGFVDMMTEEYADEKGYQRWAVTPSVLQHVGSITSKVGVDAEEAQVKGGKRELTIAEKMWNFEFEKYDPDMLRTEHEARLNTRTFS
ncbi:hypothetical protein K461DRAFT_279528 [Myriangium duriaei CBS 260.36]|uniref:Integral membrane protein n=1 Tax=Myriangium duriaei CBS 260.36 TaxID=1168546 RepID=A0A9P4J2F1_9PEZI|nr:hypothetical protein K461DRAFT_279528 [Myriangium duriaei CBS 260.36]